MKTFRQFHEDANFTLADFMDRVVATAQRGAPEDAMERVQFAMGGGVLNPVVEHVGDLTHRMAERVTWDTGGYEYIKNKVEKTLGWLTKKYGFEREFNENIHNNAEYKKIPEPEYRAKIEKALQQYAAEHRKIPVFNDAQKAARDAAVSIGTQDWHSAILWLKKLKGWLEEGQKAWTERAHAYDPNEIRQYCRQHNLPIPTDL